ncbi:MAG: hypothetical protein PX640_09250 [Microcystis sp. M49629_WE12]|nr:hypothetical protein [Microcystis sp. M49629_WE12]
MSFQFTDYCLLKSFPHPTPHTPHPTPPPPPHAPLPTSHWHLRLNFDS